MDAPKTTDQNAAQTQEPPPQPEEYAIRAGAWNTLETDPTSPTSNGWRAVSVLLLAVVIIMTWRVFSLSGQKKQLLKAATFEQGVKYGWLALQNNPGINNLVELTRTATNWWIEVEINKGTNVIKAIRDRDEATRRDEAIKAAVAAAVESNRIESARQLKEATPSNQPAPKK